MLVLSQKPGNTIRVGDVDFTILEVRGNKVRVGVSAPQEVQITRLEAPRVPQGSSCFDKTAS